MVLSKAGPEGILLWMKVFMKVLISKPIQQGASTKVAAVYNIYKRGKARLHVFENIVQCLS